MSHDRGKNVEGVNLPHPEILGYDKACMKRLLLLIILVALFFPVTTHARVTPNDTYQQKRAEFESRLQLIGDADKKQKVVQADQLLNQVNQKVCQRFDEDVTKLAAIMEELRRRKGIKETAVAFTGNRTPIQEADYWVNFTQEAIAYQKIQDYTPLFSSEAGVVSSVTLSANRLKGDLNILKNKILKAKGGVKKALDYYEL